MNNKGFTLVEELVASIILAVLAGVVYIVFLMHNAQIRESSAMAKMQRQYENVTLALSRSTRHANRILKYGSETWQPEATFAALGADSGVGSVTMYNSEGQIIAGYSVAGDTFREWRSGAWTAFEGGGGAVLVDGAQSRFVLDTWRRRLGVMLTLRTVAGDSVFTLPQRKDAYVCRN